MQNGQIGLNAIQRRYARVSTGDKISVSRFVDVSFSGFSTAFLPFSDGVLVTLCTDLFHLKYSTLLCLL